MTSPVPTSDKKWKALREGIRKIQMQASSSVSFEKLYRICFDMVIYGRAEELYNGLREVVSKHLSQKIREDVLNSINNSFFSTLRVSLDDHQKAMEVIAAVALHLDKSFVLDKNIDSVYEMGMKIFRDEIIHEPTIYKHLKEVLFSEFLRERNGKRLDKDTIRIVCAMLISLGKDVYDGVFEKNFLKHLAEFYRNKSKNLIANHTASIYIRKIEALFVDEMKRCRDCFDPSTEWKVSVVFGEEFIEKRMKTIVEMENSGIVLVQVEDDDLQCIMNELRAHVSKCYKERGKALVVMEEKEFALDYIQKLLDVQERFDALHKKSFEDSLFFNKVISCDFAWLINSNPKSAENLSLFIDNKLRERSNQLSEQELEVILNKTMILLRYLQNKDTFKRCYRKHLSRRLLGNKSISYDSEKSMIVKLMKDYGRLFIYDIERMLADVPMSASNNFAFKDYIQETGTSLKDVDLSVRVLTTGYWPVIQTNANYSMPPVLGHAFDVFRNFYRAKYNCRKLMLQCHMGMADLFATFHEPTLVKISANIEYIYRKDHEHEPSSKNPSRHSVIFRVSTLQMIILLLFNERNKWNFEEIRLETNIPAKGLTKALQSLTSGKLNQCVLLKESKGELMDANHIFVVNDGFASERHKIRIKMVIEQQDESELGLTGTRAETEDERKHMVEAAIIRAMKSRKNLQHSLLLAEVSNELKHRFAVNPVITKKHIEDLIKKGYMRKSYLDKNIYEYISKTDWLQANHMF